MQTMRYILIFVTAFFVLAAATDKARAGFEADNVEVFVPTSAWLVGPATLQPVSDSSFTMPCVMMNQYTNGFVVRFSGNSSKILAMAVDFRADILSTGKDYDVKLSIPDRYSEEISAVAHNASTMLISAKQQGAFYDALKSGKYLYLTVGGKELNFALLGVKDGLQRVADCYSPQQAPSQPPAQGFRETINRMSSDEVPPAYSAAINQKGYTPATINTAKTGDDMTPLPDEAFVVAPAAKSAEAIHADDIRQKVAALDAMLKNAESKLAGLEPAAGSGRRTAPVQQDVAIQQSAQTQLKEQVAAKPLGKPLASTWSSPLNNRAKGLEQRDIVVASQGYADVSPQYAAPATATQRANPAAASVSREKRWRAIGGTNLHEVLDVWTKSANVQLIWKTENEFSVEESLSVQGTFEEAVLDILQQYDDGKRPVGRIYIDPVLHQRVLLIETQKGS